MQNMKLKKVLGFTTNGRNSFITQPNTDNLIYVAGCVVVILKPKLNTQTHLVSDSKHNITSLAISEDGLFLATADCALKATIYIWDLTTLTLVARFTAHNVEVSCMAFSSNSHLLVSVGSQHDLVLSIWDWRRQQRLASHKISSKVRAVSFSQDGSYFVTAGEGQIKYWFLQSQSSSVASNDSGADINSSTLSSGSSSISLSCKSATLGEQKKNSFCDVKCGRGVMSNSTFCITKTGLLCELNSKRLLHKWVDLRTSSAACLALGTDLIVIGCANGVVRCFSSTDLRFLKNLPRPHSLGKDVSKKITAGAGANSNQIYPATMSVGLNEDFNTIACVYNDRSIYLWDLGNQNHVSKRYSALYHSSCIWGIDMYPSSLQNPLLPPGSFVTCSSDDTLRIWNSSVFNTRLSANKIFFRTNSGQVHSVDRDNILDGDDDDYIHYDAADEEDCNQPSREALKIIYTDSSYKFLCDLDQAEDKVDQNYDSNEGLRCLRISPDGKHLAVGSRSGAIRIFDLESDLELKSIAAHDAEVLCLEYSDPNKFRGFCYLASSSRDKLIHIFNAANGYQFLQTIDDHVSSITAIRFVNNRAKDCLQLISCGADQKIIFRNGSITTQSGAGGQQLHFIADQLVEGKNTFYDMEVDSESSCLMTACQDRMIRLFNVAQVKYQSGFRGSLSSEGTLIKIALDPTCTFLAASSTDKSISIYDYQRGECIASVSHGLSDLLTDLKFSTDGRHLIACSGDGCIFIWSSPAEIANAIGSNQAGNLPSASVVVQSPPQPISSSACSPVSLNNNNNSKENNERREREAEQRARLRSLPEWARQQMLDELDRSRTSGDSYQSPDSNINKELAEDHLYEDIDRNRRNQQQQLLVRSTFNDSLNNNAAAAAADDDDDEYQVRCAATNNSCAGEVVTMQNNNNNRSDSGGEEFGINRCDTLAARSSSSSSATTLQRTSLYSGGSTVADDSASEKHMLSSSYVVKGRGSSLNKSEQSGSGGLDSGSSSRMSSQSNRAKLLQSRDNLERIVSRERFVAEGLEVRKTEGQQNCFGRRSSQTTPTGAAGNASLSGIYNTSAAQRLTSVEGRDAGSVVSEERNCSASSERAGVGKLAKSSGLSRSSHALLANAPPIGQHSSSVQDSSDDELSSIDNERRALFGGQHHQSGSATNLAALPGNSTTTAAAAAAKLICSPKPYLPLQQQQQRQSRRSAPMAVGPDSASGNDYNHTTGNYMGTVSSAANLARAPRGGVARKVYANATASPLQQQQQQQQSHLAIRSSRSECNLESYGLELGDVDNELLCLGTGRRRPDLVYCEKLDLSRLSPGEAALSKELCQYVVEELQAISKYATRLHQKLLQSGANVDRNLSSLVARGVQNSMDILSIVPPRAPHNHQFQSQVYLGPATLQSRRSRPSSQPRRSHNVAVSPVPVSGGGGGGIGNRKIATYLAKPAADPSAADFEGGKLASQISGAQLGPQVARTGNNQMNIDQVLEAYSDRLFKMVQERMVGQSGGAGHQVGAINNMALDSRSPGEQTVSTAAKTSDSATLE